MREEPSNGAVVTVSANALVSNRPCILTALSLNPAAAGCTVSLYDPAPLPYLLTAGVATSTGATLRATLVAPASVSSVCLPLTSGIEFSNGCVAVVTGAGATATVAFAKI